MRVGRTEKEAEVLTAMVSTDMEAFLRCASWKTVMFAKAVSKASFTSGSSCSQEKQGQVAAQAQAGAQRVGREETVGSGMDDSSSTGHSMSTPSNLRVYLRRVACRYRQTCYTFFSPTTCPPTETVLTSAAPHLHALSRRL